MYLARSPYSFPFSRVAQGSVVTIGAFDGLHLGHQKLLNRVLEEASERNCPTVVMSFEPTPKEYFSANRPPARLTRFRQKFAALDRMGIDVFYCPNFNPAMQNIGADTFIRQLLIHALNVRHLVIGDDFAFARNREGNVSHLHRAGRAMNFSVEQVSTVVVEDERVSSTAIRDALREGDTERARRLLGNNYRMSGRIINRRDENGSIPLIFVARQRRPVAVQGIFAVKVRICRGKWLDAVAFMGGCRAGDDRESIFALYIPKQDRHLYGEYVDIDFLSQLSNEDHFNGVAELSGQLMACYDEATAVPGNNKA